MDQEQVKQEVEDTTTTRELNEKEVEAKSFLERFRLLIVEGVEKYGKDFTVVVAAKLPPLNPERADEGMSMVALTGKNMEIAECLLALAEKLNEQA